MHLSTPRVDCDRLSVTFSPGYGEARFPNPQLLALRVACAQVTHISGAAETFGGLEHDIEDTRVFAFNECLLVCSTISCLPLYLLLELHNVLSRYFVASWSLFVRPDGIHRLQPAPDRIWRSHQARAGQKQENLDNYDLDRKLPSLGEGRRQGQSTVATLRGSQDPHLAG